MPVNFQINGTDLEDLYVSKSYLIDRYPELANTFTSAGLWAWGSNTYGEIGDGTKETGTIKSSPVQTIAGGTNWTSVASASTCTAAIRDGRLWFWGLNYMGLFGNFQSGGLARYSSPVQTSAGGTTWKQVDVTGGTVFGHTAAIKTDGTLWVWGDNRYGQIADNTIIHRSTATQTVSGGTNWKQCSAGYVTTAAIKTDGTLWAWGNGGNGVIGDNAAAGRSSPVQTVAGGTNWKQVSVGKTYTGAIKTDGTLWMWGNNADGQLGDNTIIHRSSPVQTVAGGNNWKQVVTGQTGQRQVLALKTDGTLWGWGANANGELATNDIVHRSSPVQTVAGGTNWKFIGRGAGPMSCIKTDGTLWMWGGGGTGALGDNTAISKSSPVQTISGGTNWKTCSGSFAIRDHTIDLGLGIL
jgi:alpha-tubulin suppressor-like RCC1 family protein